MTLRLHNNLTRQVEPFAPLDPSCPSSDGKVAKMGIDATTPLRDPRPVTRNRIPAEVLDRIDLAEILKKR